MGYKNVPPPTGVQKYIKGHRYEIKKRTIYDNSKRCVFFRPILKGKVYAVNYILVYVSKRGLHNVAFKFRFCKSHLNG